MKAQNADIGICFDGDADRVIFVDHHGNTISGDRVLGLCAIALKEEGKLTNDILVATVMSNLGLSTALAEHGINVTATGVGDRQVIECMRREGHALGGENSGHIIFSDNATTGDGIMSALKVLAFMKRKDKSLSELADCMTEFPQELHGINVTEKPAIDTIPEVKEAITSAEASLGDLGRVLVRNSGTENKIRVLVEAKDAAECSRHAADICKSISNTIGL